MPRHHRAVALLLVLAVLVIAVSAAVTAAGIASTSQLQQRLDHCTRIADDLLIAADAPIHHWLAATSQHVVLPPEASEPRIEILRNQWTINGIDHTLTITAWDQTGMLPFTAIRSHPTLASAVPPEVVAAVREVLERPAAENPAQEVRPGLDWFERCDSVSDGKVRVYPSTFDDEHVSDSVADQRTPAIGGLIAMHGAAGARARGTGPAPASASKPDSFAVNVNTAPIELIERCLLAAGRGGLEQIVQARAEAKQATIGGLSRFADAQESAPNLVGQSSAWGIRIDIGVGAPRVSRSWWRVYTRTGSRSPQDQGGLGWECIQTLVIDE